MRDFIVRHYSRRKAALAILIALVFLIAMVVLVRISERGGDSSPDGNDSTGNQNRMVIGPQGDDSGQSAATGTAADASSPGSQAGDSEAQHQRDGEAVTLDADQNQGQVPVSAANRQIQGLAKRHDLSFRDAVIPRHPVIGDLPPAVAQVGIDDALLRTVEDAEFWSNLAWDSTGRQDTPRGPFRRSLPGRITRVGAQRYRLSVVLDSFENRYFVDTVLYFTLGEYRLESFRYLQ